MSKFVIVGHPCSGFETVADLLHQNGLAHLRPSKEKKRTFSDINSLICEAHGIAEKPPQYRNPPQQIEAGSVWNSLARDLLKANFENDAWAVADPLAVYLLDFWKNAIPDLIFVFVYDHPRSAILHSKDSGLPNPLEHLDEFQAILGWQNFNEALNAFRQKNESKCIWVNPQISVETENTFLREYTTLQNAKSSSQSSDKANPALPGTATENPVGDSKTENETTPPLNTLTPLTYIEAPLKEYMADALIKKISYAMDLFQTLQTNAAVASPNEDGVTADVTEAWQSLKKILSQNTLLIDKLKKARTQIEKAFENQRELQLAETQIQALQTQLEQSFLKNLDYERRMSSLDDDIIAADHNHNTSDKVKTTNPDAPTGAVERFKTELEYKVGTALLKYLKIVIAIPFIAWKIKRITGNHFEAERRLKHEQLPLASYADYAEVVKAKRHLTYKMGVTWLRYSYRTFGWLIMPFALLRTVLKHRKYQKQKKARAPGN